MRTVLSVVLAAVLLAPNYSVASDISFIVSGGELAVSFGLAPFQVSDDVEANDFFVFGSARLVSGPLLNIVVDAVNGFTDYAYGAGTLELTLSGSDENGEPVEGTFLAPTEPFSFLVCEGCDVLFGGGLADDFAIGLGQGLFDAPLAKLFGVARQTLGGFIDFGLEDIDGGPLDDSRRGFDHRGFANLIISARRIPLSEKMATRYSLPRMTKVATPACPLFFIVSASNL